MKALEVRIHGNYAGRLCVNVKRYAGSLGAEPPMRARDNALQFFIGSFRAKKCEFPVKKCSRKMQTIHLSLIQPPP